MKSKSCYELVDRKPIPADILARIAHILKVNDVKMYCPEKNTMKEVIEGIIEERKVEDCMDDTPFYVVNLAEIVRKYMQWMEELPNIQPHYAVKCNPDPLVLQVLHALGCGFDCATKSEIMRVMDFGVEPSEIVYANTTKMVHMLNYAKQKDVRLMTVDCAYELEKTHKLFPEAELLIRIITDDKYSTVVLSKKFGATLSEAHELLKLARTLKMKVVGVAFHAGCDCKNPSTYSLAIKHSRQLFDWGREMGHDMRILDIGGGYPGEDSEEINLKMIAKSIKDALEVSFAGYPSLRLISEPGKFFVNTGYHLVSQIICKKVRTCEEGDGPDDDLRLYYINESCYGTFFDLLLIHWYPIVRDVIPLDKKAGSKLHPSIVFGPTCDSTDTIGENIMLPELQPGDFLVTPDIGAYSTCMVPGEETFNGFDKPINKYIFF